MTFSPVIDSTDQNFEQDVLHASHDALVLVDFWAPWCGPCRQLTPTLEKIVKGFNNTVRLVKINIDESPAFAGQLGVQSIPAVFAFYQGRPVDGFMGAKPESQIVQFIDRLIQSLGITNSQADLMAQVEGLMAAKDFPAACQILSGILNDDPEDSDAVGLFTTSLLSMGDLEGLRVFLEGLSPAMAKLPAVLKVKARLELVKDAPVGDDLDAMRAVLASPPEQANEQEWQARLALSLNHFLLDEVDSAFALLLDGLRRDATWAEGKALLLRLFEAQGIVDPQVVRARRQLSALLFS
ncbi:MAG: thioredoxin [Alphaproteobacteria bacterium]|nr:thioredoxin [Alphaproteobacteria bacterium]